MNSAWCECFESIESDDGGRIIEARLFEKQDIGGFLSKLHYQLKLLKFFNVLERICDYQKRLNESLKLMQHISKAFLPPMKSWS